MELDKNIEQELAGLLADPEKVSLQHAAMLNDLLQEYPYYQPLHLLLAKANQEAEQNNALARAALYTNGYALHRFLFEKKESKTDFRLNEVPAAIGEDLPVVTDEQETFEEISESFTVEPYEGVAVAQPEPIEADAEEEFLSSQIADEQETFEEISEPFSFVRSETSVIAAENILARDEQETFEEISEPSQFQIIPPPTEQDIPAEDTSAAAEENVFEEIGELDYDAYRPFRNSVQADDSSKQEEPSSPFYTVTPQVRIETPEDGLNEDENNADFDSSDSPEDEQHTEQVELEKLEQAETGQIAPAEPEAQKNTLEDDFVFESIVSTDFFAFENNFSAVEEVQPDKPEVAAPPVIEEHDEAAAAEVENSRVSNYNDDKLPYTFLWWLAKTRKEHQSTFQPYVTAKKPGSQELQQQYVEHIFHLQSHLTGTELLDNEEEAKPASKDSQIIDSFIKNDPQIHAPNAEQIDNENKAKKSAEDQNDLVSETLAGIYIEQMLYDKAIDTYEKLSLKFPEKSRYFADLIQSIEKKI